VVDRHAIVPNMFSGDQSHPMKYFRYINRSVAPPADWYTDSLPTNVDWGAIACSYDYVLVTKPFQPFRKDFQMTVAAENSSGTVFAIDKRQCSGRLAPAG
jgi:hypothetical protein